jgi:hypothetical protein
VAATGTIATGTVAIGAAVTNSSLPVDLVLRSSTGIPLTGTIRTATTATKGIATAAATKGIATATATKGIATAAATKGIATATATKGIATATATKEYRYGNQNGRCKKGKYVSEADAIKEGDRPAPGFAIAKKSLTELRLVLLHVASQTTKAFSHCYTSLELLLKAKWQRIRPPAPPRISTHVYEIRPRGDKHGIDLISDVLPYSPLWYAGPTAISNAISFAKFT